MSDNEPRLVRIQVRPLHEPESDNSANVAGALEALLLLAAEPVTEFELAQAVGVPESVVAETLAELVAFYYETGRGFELREVGWGLAVLHAGGVCGPDHSVHPGGSAVQAVAGRSGDAGGGRLHPADFAARVSAVRGVNVDGVMRTLLARGLDRGGRP